MSKSHRRASTAGPMCAAPAAPQLCMAPDAQAQLGNAELQARMRAAQSGGAGGNQPKDRALAGMGGTASKVNTGVSVAAGQAAMKFGDMTKAQNGLFGGAMVGATAPLAMMGHYYGDNQVADSDAGHMASSGVKTALDTATDIGTKAAVGAGTAAAPAIIAGLEAKKAIGGGVDAVGAMGAWANRSSDGYRQGERVEENATNGKYGAPAQALTAAVSPEAREKLIDHKAETGQRGLLAAWGNFAGDSMADAAGHGQRSGGHYTNADEELRRSRERKIYKPWTW